MLMVLTSCASGDYRSGPPPPPTSTTTLAPEVTVRAAVAAFSPSARVITLVQPVGGFTSVALAADTEMVRARGGAAAVTDLVPRATFDVTGRPGGPGTLVARRIVLL
ncbi:MAG: hypothetical protein ACR2KK_08215 [Acidimicrobiales bacterium]